MAATLQPIRIAILENNETFASFTDRTSVLIDALGINCAFFSADGAQTRHICRFAAASLQLKIRAALAFRNLVTDQSTLLGETESCLDQKMAPVARVTRFPLHWDPFIQRTTEGAIRVCSRDGLVTLTLAANERVFKVCFPVRGGTYGATALPSAVVNSSAGWPPASPPMLCQLFPVNLCPSRWLHPLSVALQAAEHFRRDGRLLDPYSSMDSDTLTDDVVLIDLPYTEAPASDLQPWQPRKDAILLHVNIHAVPSDIKVAVLCIPSVSPLIRSSQRRSCLINTDSHRMAEGRHLLAQFIKAALDHRTRPCSVR